MDEKLNPEILDKLTKVCICKGISRSKIREAVKDGAHTVADVQKATGAGSGSCGGKRCTPKIEELLQQLL